MKKKASKQRKKLSTSVFIHHANVYFFLISLWTCSHFWSEVNTLHCFIQFLLCYFLHLFGSDCFAALTSLEPYKLLIFEFFKNQPQRAFRNINLSNLENVLRVLRADRTRKCIIRATGDTCFENLIAQCQPSRHSCWLKLYACPKQPWIHHCLKLYFM